MLRTRDFALMLSAIVFLLVAITATWSNSMGFTLNGAQMAAVFQSSDDEKTFTGVLEENTGPTHADRVASFKKRIASLGRAEVAVVAPEEVPVVPEASATTADVKENRCGNYYALQTAWSPYGVKFEEVEGARLVYRESAAAPAASSTPPAVSNREILAQLPVRSIPLPSQSCIATDVVGIATDGSLIRNNEIGMYKVFGSETLVGYALDGFPIYGLSSAQTDICGGSMASGQYRYQLTSNRDVMLNCFAGSPVSL